MSFLYFNCASGVSGDMVVGSLLDLGISNIKHLSSELEKLSLDGYSINVYRMDKAGISATKFSVEVNNEQPARNHADIRMLIDGSTLEEKVKKTANTIFYNLASSEASAHKTTIEEVHFHEVGAVDSIIDIVSTAILLNRLRLSGIYCSTISLGTGKVRTEHGLMDVPVPAVRELLKEAPTKITGTPGELTTPTGAAIIKTCVKKYTDTTADITKKATEQAQ